MAGRFSVEAVFKAVDRITAPITRMQNRVGKFTRSMEAGLRKVNRMLSKVTRKIKGAAAASLKFGGLVFAAGAAAMVKAINTVADAADNLAKRTRRIKFPIEEFQQWQFVAEQSGIGTDEFDKSLEKFTKTIGEARSETGTLFTILNKTNKPLLKQLQATSNAADAFDIYIDAIRGTENQLDKTALATAAFGRTGAKFLNITEQSAAAVKALRLEQKQNGIITKEQAAAAEDYNDAANSLKKSLFGMLQQIIIPMLPAITKLLRGWRQWIVANKEMIKSKITKFLISIANAITSFILKIKKMNKEGKLLKDIKSIVEGIADAFEFLKIHGATIAKIIAGIFALSLVLKVVTVVMGVFNLIMAANPIGLIVIAIAALIAGLALLLIEFPAIIGTLKEMPGVVMRAWDGFAQFFIDLWDGIVNIFDQSIARISDFIDSITDKVKIVTDAVTTVNNAVRGKVSEVVGGISGFFGFGDNDDADKAQPTPQTISPQERLARTIDEQRTINTNEVTIRDESGRAEVTSGGKLGPGLQLINSGAF